MTKHDYILVDVFTDRQFGGNPLAVFPDGNGIDTAAMQTIAAELNLSETVFVVDPDDAAHACRLRIFTPKREMPIAGHPTVGTGWVLQRLGRIPGDGQVVFEEGVGPIPVTLRNVDGSINVEMEQPVPTFGQVYADRGLIAAMLSVPDDAIRADVPVQVVSAGVPFLYVPLTGLAAMRQVQLRLDLFAEFWAGETPVDIFVLTMETEDPAATVHSRMFAPTMNIPEDPATGAASGPLGAYLVKHGLVTPADAPTMIGEQGYEMGRPSRIGIHVTSDGETISRVSISGTAVPVGGGGIELKV